MRVRGGWLVALAAWTMIGCGDDAVIAPAPAPASKEALFERGPHAVGFYETEVSYDPVGPETTRSLKLRVWYPAVAGGEAPAEYSVAGIISLPAEGAIASPAPIAQSDLPLAIYSHGFAGVGLLAYPYGELMASHGWVVMAPNHTGNTAVDAIGEGFDPIASITVNRPLDITAVIDWAAQDVAGEIAGLSVASEAVFMFGHSYGAYTTFASGGVDLDVEGFADGCTEPDCSIFADPEVMAAYADFGDSRIVAIAPQAPAVVPDYADGSLAALKVPTLLQSGRRDATTTQTEQAQPAWEGLDHPDDLWVELPDGGHLSFISICDDLEKGLLDAFQPGNEDDGCGESFTPVAQAVPALAAYLLAFANLHVLGQEDWRPILTGEPLDASVEVTVGH